MKKTALFGFMFIFFAILCGGEPLWQNLRDGGRGEKIFYLPQFSEFKEISNQDMLFFKKVQQKSEKEKALAIIMELDTPGGSVDIALKYISLFARSKVPLVVFLNPQGISAGMIIALGADRIAINPLGVIGDAMPIQQQGTKIRPLADRKRSVSEQKNQQKNQQNPPQKVNKSTVEQIIEELRKHDALKDKNENQALADQKFLTVFYKIMELLAQKNNRPVKVIRAACDPYIELKKDTDGIDHKSGSPLTLSAAEAERLGVVDYIVKDKSELLDAIGAPQAELVEIKKDAIEQIISFLSHPMLSGLLLTLGLIGIFIEIRTPGFGVSGTLGTLFIVLFFLGHVASGASEWGPMVVFFVGLILLLLEIFLVPGFGIVGILGFGCIIFSLLSAFGSGNLQTGMKVVVLSLLAVMIICILLYMYILPKSQFFGRFMLNATSGETEKSPIQQNTSSPVSIGMHGITITPLKPTGKINFNGEILEGRSFDGSVIAENTAVCAIKINPFEIEVKKEENI